MREWTPEMGKTIMAAWKSFKLPILKLSQATLTLSPLGFLEGPRLHRFLYSRCQCEVSALCSWRGAAPVGSSRADASDVCHQHGWRADGGVTRCQIRRRCFSVSAVTVVAMGMSHHADGWRGSSRSRVDERWGPQYENRVQTIFRT